MTSRAEHDHPVANPDRTVLDKKGRQREAGDDRAAETDPHDQPWPDVAREVKEAVEHADGPLD